MKEGHKSGNGGLTPMMEQYQRMRRSLPDDVLLLFRLGDFYELFFEDAKEAAGILHVALTKRNGVPMCGVPHHAAEGYVARLIKAGKRVAIAEQTTEPKPGKIVEREITQVISAGTISDMNLLEPERPNYLAAVYRVGKTLGLAYVDHSTGEFRVTEFGDGDLARSGEDLRDELARVNPAELLVSDEQVEEEAFQELPRLQPYDGYAFLPDQARHGLKEHFRVQSLDGFGCGGMEAGVGAAGAVLHYLSCQMRRDVRHIRQLKTCVGSAHVQVDEASQLNLELVQSRAGSRHTLLHALDRTVTPMGSRKLRDWVLHPLRDLEALRARQQLVGALVREPFVLHELRSILKRVRDVERIVARLSAGSGNPRDLLALAASLREVPCAADQVEALARDGLAGQLRPRLRDFTELAAGLERALVDEPPASAKEGGIFRDGYRQELDQLRTASREGKQWIADLQVREIQRTGIKSLKVKYNAVFGYFLEVTNSNLDSVPPDYIRKQTTTNSERFVTPELKEMEDRILGADERARQLEAEEFLNLRESVLEHLDGIQDTAQALADLDVIGSLAETARMYGYCQPQLTETRQLRIVQGRHPVLDQSLSGEKFVPNDTWLEPEANRLILLTGPNMAGKSTYIRQVALITLMAQIGSWVPAESAEIGLTDRIFTRVGASDDLSRGQSTFMVEMNETALIVNHATERSLVILDEIGRGTSTFDGLSIAWSVAEHLHDKIGARTLFATHYHELTALEESRCGVRNYSVAVREWKDEIIFLRKIVPGKADQSYGIQVARLAGLPDSVVMRAKEILAELEGGAGPAPGGVESGQGPRPAKKRREPTTRVKEGAADEELLLFG